MTMMDKDRSVLESLKQMLQHCQEMKELLRNDQNFFSKNEFSAIEASNKRKMELVHKFNTISNELNVYYLQNRFGTFLETIEKNIENVSAAAKHEFQTVLAELKTEIMHCYKYMSTNGSIVFSSLNRLKEVWNKLSLNQSGSESVYDKSGSIR